MAADITDSSRALGCLLGLAVGDAVGTTVEFRAPGSFRPVTDMTGGGPFGLRAGEWTDDTSMALCLAESLVNRATFDPEDQMRGYLKWYRRGHLSSNGRCFDIGGTVRAALLASEASGEPYSGSIDPRSAGNGSLMRLAPVPIRYSRTPGEAVRLAGLSSRTTHGAASAVDSCRFYCGVIVGALHGVPKADLLAPMYSPPGAQEWAPDSLHHAVAAVAQGSYKTKEPPAIVGSGYVVESMEAALWAFFHSTSFRDGCLLATNLGDDADTTAAIYGQLAGAYYGLEGIPQEWLEKLAQRDLIEGFARQLWELSGPRCG